MKTYKQLMEVMSISDMNKITGGTAAQRKIAQDRQRAREAKDKGFDPNKSVMADGSKPSEEQKEKEKAPAPQPTQSSSAIVKVEKPKPSTGPSVGKLDTVDQIAKKHGVSKPTPLTKADASKDRAANAAKELEKRKPDLRKSQIGKWSQGVKNSPGKLAKKSGAIVKAQETKPAPPEIQKADVKVLKKDGMQGQQANKPGTTKPTPAPTTPEVKKPKKPLNIGKHLNRLRKGAQKGVGLVKKGLDMGGEAPVDTYGEGEKRGLQQRNKGLGN